MKKLNFIFALFLFAGLAIGQQVDREQVIVEIGTGTW